MGTYCAHHSSFPYLHRLCSHGGLAEAIRYVDTFIKPRAPIPVEILAHLLRECKRQRSLELGRKVHTLIKDSGLQRHAQLSSQLIDMFSSRGSIGEAAHVFQTSPEPHPYAWSAIMCAYVQNGLYEETMLLYAKMQGSTSHTTVEAFIYVLKACINVSALPEGRLIHSDTIRQGLHQHLFLGSILIKMYSRCGSLADAFIVLDMLPIRDSACWSALICESVQHGCHLDAFRYYDSMKKEGFQANIAAFLGMLKACAFTCDLDGVKMLYMDIVKAGFELDLHIGNALVDTYSKCGSFDESCIVFNRLSSRSAVVLWSSMVAGYLQHGRGQEAVELFKEMQKERIPPPDNITYLHLIKACTGMGDIASGHFIHAHMFHIGIDLDPYIQSSLVEMYARSGKLGDAKKVFDMSPRNDNVLLAVMSKAYIDSGQEEQSLYLLAKMMQSDVEPDKVLFLCLLKSCMSMLAMEQGRLVHSHILKQGFYLDLHIATALIDMYAQCGSIQDAYNVFENMPNRDAACWNVLISSLSDNGHSQEALYMYEKMQQNCSSHCEVTSCSVLTACSRVGAIDKGKLIHLDVVKNGGDSLSMIANALVDLYGKCGNLEDAYDVFKKLQGKDVISWSSIISAHVQNWHCEEAFYLFDKMQAAGFDPDHVTFACMAKACANTKSKRYGEFVHSEVMKRGMNSDGFVGNAMVSMYAKMGDIIATLKVFESLAKVQAVAWNSLMWGLSELDMNEKAFQLFREMQREDVVQLDPITYVSVMKSLSDVAGLSAVRVLHIDMICQGFESNIMVQNTLIVVYAKCGSINDASAVFQLMQIRSIVSWNSIMDSYGEHGDYAFVLHCLEGMQEEGIVPNGATFVCILSACSHGGLIEEAYHVYNTMTETAGLVASVQHTVCMIDALGRAGCLDEATALLSGIPFQPDSAMWINLLGSSAKYKHITTGDWAFEHLQQLDPKNAAGYMLLSNIYSNSYSLEKAYHFRESLAFCRL